jgi:hypothetical protein
MGPQWVKIKELRKGDDLSHKFKVSFLMYSILYVILFPYFVFSFVLIYVLELFMCKRWSTTCGRRCGGLVE